MTVPKNLVASVHQKLLNKARESHRPFNDLLQYYAIERFLYRLSHSPLVGHFVLKGALMFQVWGLPGFRPTRDIDLLGHSTNTVEYIAGAFQQICRVEVEADGLLFDADSVQGEKIQEDASYEGVRVTFVGWLGNARIPMQIDIGFGDAITPEPAPLLYPVILDFPAPALSGYPRESVIAEKFQAMVALGEINSRMKDFYDIFTLAMNFDFDGNALQKAIERTFLQRQTSLPANAPVAFGQEFVRQKAPLWDVFLRRVSPGQQESFDSVVATLGKFLLPPVRASIHAQVFEMLWKKGQDWRQV